EHTPLVELAFAPPPRTLSLDADEVSILLVSRARMDAPPHDLPLSLVWTRAGAPATTLLTRTPRPGETAQLRFAPRELGGPGPGELQARLGGETRIAETRAQIVATASVALKVPSELTLSSNGEGALPVELSSRGG